MRYLLSDKWGSGNRGGMGARVADTVYSQPCWSGLLLVQLVEFFGGGYLVTW